MIMNLAVKFYSTMQSDDENVLAGIDGSIPAEVRFNTDTPPDDTFTIMTEEEYQAYLASIQSELQDWKTMQEAVEVID